MSYSWLQIGSISVTLAYGLHGATTCLLLASLLILLLAQMTVMGAALSAFRRLCAVESNDWSAKREKGSPHRFACMYPQWIQHFFRCILDSPSAHYFRTILAPDTVSRLPSTAVNFQSRQASSTRWHLIFCSLLQISYLNIVLYSGSKNWTFIRFHSW